MYVCFHAYFLYMMGNIYQCYVPPVVSLCVVVSYEFINIPSHWAMLSQVCSVCVCVCVCVRVRVCV